MEHAGKRGVLLVGNPGSGKTAFVSHLLCSRTASPLIHDRIAGYHFCMHSDRGTQNAAKFVGNLANMVASNFPDYSAMISSNSFVRRVLQNKCAQAPEWCFQEGILTPLKHLPNKPKETWFIVIDALDECSANGNEEILSMLKSKARRFPKWLKLIITSRNVSTITSNLADMQILELRSGDQRNLEDIDTYSSLKVYPLHTSILHRIKTYFSIKDNNTPDQKVVISLMEKAQGNFLFLKAVLNFLLETPESVSWTEQEFPKTLDNIFQLNFERKFNSRESFRSLREIFEILVAAYTPLSAEDIYSLLKLDNPDLDYEYDLMPKLEEMSLFLWDRSEKGLVRIYHASLSEWLTSESNKGKFYYVKKRNGHRRLAEYYLQNLKRTMKALTPEEALYLTCHIVEAGSNQTQVHDFQTLPSNLFNGSDEAKTTSLHLSSRLVNPDVTELLMKHFYDIDCLDSDHRTPAFIAATNGWLNNLIILFERGANINHTVTCPVFKVSRDAQNAVRECRRRTCEYSLLHIAAQEGNVDILKFLIEHHVNALGITGSNNTAAQLAAANGHLEAVVALKKAGAILDGISLHHAAAEGHSHVVEYLLKEGVRDDCIDLSSFMEFCQAGNKKQNINLHLYDNKHLTMRETALHVAAKKDHPSVITSLLSDREKSAINCVNIEGRRPLHEAVYYNNYNALKAMLAAGVNTSVRCNASLQTSDLSQNYCSCEFTPLHIAAKHGYHSAATLLIKQNADLNVGDCNGSTPLHIASCHGMVSLITLLVGSGASINGRSFNGSTPLHSAAACCATNSYRPLFALGSDFLAKDSKNMTALNYIVKDVDFVGMEYFVDLYVDNPNAWIEVGLNEKEPWEERDLHYSWLNEMIKLTKSYTAHIAATWQLWDSVNLEKTYNRVLFAMGERANASLLLTGINDLEHTRLVTFATPRAFFHDLFNHGVLKGIVPAVNKPYEPTLVQESLLKALSRTFVTLFPEVINCSMLTSFVRANILRSVNTILQVGFDVNCQDQLGVTPLLSYLHTGGRHMSKVLVKHRATITISCDDPFENSMLHLLSYHKLHYLHYLPQFLHGDEMWYKYLTYEHSLFDYFLNKYEGVQNKVNKETILTGDGPLALAIKSHPRGTKVINECFDAEGFNALHRAAQGANVIAIKKFLAWGADPFLENSDGYSPLWLAVLHSVKYTPSLNLHKRNVITALEVEFASMSASVILEHLLRRGTIDIGCSESRPNLTLYHIAAIRGMWQFVAHLLSEKQITGIDVNCPNKDGVTPMYLAMLVGGSTCDCHSPWCKVIQIINSYGGTLRYPTLEAEYFLMFDLFFGMSPGHMFLELTEHEILTLQGSCGQDECKEYKSGHYALSKSSCELNFLYSDYSEQVDQCFMCPKGCLPEMKKNLPHFQFVKSVFDDQRPLISEHGVIRDNFVRFLEKESKRIKMFLLEVTKPSVRVLYECTEKCKKRTIAIDQDKMFIKSVNLESAMRKFYHEFKASLDKLQESSAQAKSYIFSKGRPPHVLLEISSAMHNYGITLSCDWQAVAAKYVMLSFQVRNFQLGLMQLKKISRVVSISDFASSRMKKVFIEPSQETMKLILRLASEKSSDFSDDFYYLTILRFRKPPLWKGTFDIW